MRPHNVKMKTLFSFALAATFLGSNLAPASADQSIIDNEFPGILGMPVCQSVAQLDCVESLNGIEGERVILGSFVETLKEIPWTDSRGNNIQETIQTWVVPFTSGSATIKVKPSVETENFIIDSQGKRAAAMRFFLFDEAERLDLLLQLVVRTSWLKPGAVGLSAANGDYKVQKIPGGRKWTFIGSRAQTAGYTDNWWEKYNSNAYADTAGTQHYFIIDHSGKDNASSWWDTSCDSKGFTTTSSNATMAGQPFWDATKKSLNFNLYGPHLDSQGKLNRGFFRFWASTEYLKCRWPASNFGQSNKFEVSVFNEDGTKQVATTVASVKEGILKVEAFNFHYSSPTIRLSAAKSAITCVNKAKKSLKVTAVKPVCPKGYKKK